VSRLATFRHRWASLLSPSQWVAVAIVGTLVLTVVSLRLEGRNWFCECGQYRFWISSPRSAHTSQHFFDPYSFTHLLHGIIFFWVLRWILPQWDWKWRVWLALFLECAWEVVENSPPVIERYRATTAALGYTGDSALNSLGDAVACLAGLFIASKFSWKVSVAIIAVIELVLLVTIRDSLLLSALSLIVDIDWLKAWQAGA
jgi:hypothetical protein